VVGISNAVLGVGRGRIKIYEDTWEMAVAAPETRPICLCTSSDDCATGISGVALGGCNLQQRVWMSSSVQLAFVPRARVVTMSEPLGKSSGGRSRWCSRVTKTTAPKAS
jgi:hypothetical protein